MMSCLGGNSFLVSPLKHGLPSPLNGTLPSRSELSGPAAHFICPAVCFLCGAFGLSCTSVFTFSSPLSAPHDTSSPPSLNSRISFQFRPRRLFRLRRCHVNNWWPVFDSPTILKGWPESWGQHQYRVKSTTVTCAPPACCACWRHSLLMTYFCLNEGSLLPAAFPKAVGFI